MATLILGTVGRAVGGPIGGIIGAAVGSVVDHSLLGGGRARESGRIANLAVQSAAYGEPIPVIAGRMRAAGNLLWTSGIKESSNQGGTSKRGNGATTAFSYSASFAVGLGAQAIAGVGRIWADGRLIRDDGGVFVSPIVMRLYVGSEAQPGDPLILAAEGAGGAPAYRGLAYAVFEELPLADYGNRIPNLTFEVIAGADHGHDLGSAIAALATIDGRSVASIRGDFPAIDGHVASRSGSVADALASLIDLAGAAVSIGKSIIISGESGEQTLIADADCQARSPGDAGRRERRKRLGGDTRIGAVEVLFHDTSRDFQPGLQRARRDGRGVTDHHSVACAMTPDQAKSLATGLLVRANASGLQMNVRLPWRYLGLQPGARVRMTGDETVWRVREVRFEAFVVNLALERIDASPPVKVRGDGGRALAFADLPVGVTTLQLLDLPALPGELPISPRLWVAAAGASPGWRRAAIEMSGDDGASYVVIGVVEGGVLQGVAATSLPAGSVAGWDRFGAVEVELLSDAVWLVGRSELSVLNGANLALLGNEIFQFSNAEAVGPSRFRLSGLLRGRRGTEADVVGHAVGDRFVMLDTASLLAFDPPGDTSGRLFRARAAGTGDADALPVLATAGGRALRPLSPAHLRLTLDNGAVSAGWVRRSRSGYGWPDFVDAPLGEVMEAYQVDVTLDGRWVRRRTVAVPNFVYGIADRFEDGDGAEVTITVAQLSDGIGPGTAASAALTI